jgi:hypothetical protein
MTSYAIDYTLSGGKYEGDCEMIIRYAVDSLINQLTSNLRSPTGALANGTANQLLMRVPSSSSTVVPSIGPYRVSTIFADTPQTVSRNVADKRVHMAISVPIMHSVSVLSN